MSKDSRPNMKFIHAADLHIDSPLEKLEIYDGAPAERLRAATRVALENLVAIAIDERVGFVVIAGDLVDGPWREMKTGIYLAAQMRRLGDAGIRVFLIRGNHDAASEVHAAISWPDCVHEFSVEAPETVIDRELGVAIHGQGFAQREVTENLAADYPDPVPDLFNVGVLHTSLGGSAEHDTYAPVSADVLAAKGYDYWALGHIHQREIVRERPWIVFAGNTQGRHIRETGAKGCLVVSTSSGEVESVEFRATDTLRWSHFELELDPDDTRAQLYDRVRDGFDRLKESNEGRFGVVRVTVSGAAAAHESLRTRAEREETIAEIRNLAGDVEELWVERVRLDVSPPVDLDEMRRRPDLVGELLRTMDEAAASDEALAKLAEELAPLEEKGALELKRAGIDLRDPAALRRWLRDAERLLSSRLWEDVSES